MLFTDFIKDSLYTKSTFIFTAVAGSLRQLEEGPEWEEGRLESGDMGRAVLHRELVLAEGRSGGSQ